MTSHTRSVGPLGLLSLVALASCGTSPEATALPAGCTRLLSPTGDVQTAVQTALINSAAGSTLCFAPGTWRFTEELSLSTPRITLRGVGAGVVWDFAGQRSGRQAMQVTGSGFTLENLELKNTRGDGVRVQGVMGVTFRRVKASWDAGSVTTNGRYAIFPVESTRVLIEDCEVVGASDAGIYVGQSSTIIVRRNIARGNVAGIEIENSSDAEVYENRATDNTAGILVFNLPNLRVQGGHNVLVRDNFCEGNNRANFAERGNIVANVPAGTGMLVLAADQLEFRGNTVRNNNSTGILVVGYTTVDGSWCRPNAMGMVPTSCDRNYNLYPDTVWIHDNTFASNGSSPQGDLAPLRSGEDPLADIVWDGLVDPAHAGMSQYALCITGNGSARFFNADFPHSFTMASSNLAPHQCMHTPLPSITL